MRTVQDVLAKNGYTHWSVNSNSSINNAIKQMAANQTGSLPVIEAGKIVGMVSDVDCIQKVILKNKPIDHTYVHEIMTRGFAYTTPTQSISDCLATMSAKHIRHLPVIANGSLIGIVSLSDLLRTIITDQQDLANSPGKYAFELGYAH